MYRLYSNFTRYYDNSSLAPLLRPILTNLSPLTLLHTFDTEFSRRKLYSRTAHNGLFSYSLTLTLAFYSRGATINTRLRRRARTLAWPLLDSSMVHSRGREREKVANLSTGRARVCRVSVDRLVRERVRE